MEDQVYHFRINIPCNETDYKRGCGESVWVATDEAKVKRCYDTDSSDTLGVVMLTNNVISFPELTKGTLVPCEFRGQMLPVIRWSYVKDFTYCPDKVKEVLDQYELPETVKYLQHEKPCK